MADLSMLEMPEFRLGDESDGDGGGGGTSPDNETDTHVDEEHLSPAANVNKYATSDNVYTREMVGRVMLQVMREARADSVCADLENLMDILVKIANDPETVVRAELVEQIPHLAMACMESNSPAISNAVHNYLFPIIVQQLLDVDTPVKKAAQGALLMLMENGLVSRAEVERLACPMVIRLSEDPIEENQTSAIVLMAKMIPLLGKEPTERLFLKRFAELCCSSTINVRKFCATNIGEFCAIIGACESYEQVVLPCYVELCRDETWAVRKACAEMIVPVSCACLPLLRRAVLAPAFLPLLNDQSRWVSIAAFQTLGPFISTFANPQITGLAYSSQAGELVLINPDGMEFRLKSPACTDNNNFPLDQFFYDIYNSREQKQPDSEKVVNIPIEFSKNNSQEKNDAQIMLNTDQENDKNIICEVISENAFVDIYEGADEMNICTENSLESDNCDFVSNESIEAVTSETAVPVGPENENPITECDETGSCWSNGVNLAALNDDHNYVSEMHNENLHKDTSEQSEDVDLDEISRRFEALKKMSGSPKQRSLCTNTKLIKEENKIKKGRNRNRNKSKAAALKDNEIKDLVQNEPDEIENGAQENLVRNNLNVVDDNVKTEPSCVNLNGPSIAGGDNQVTRSYAEVVANCICDENDDSIDKLFPNNQKPFIHNCDNRKSTEPENECLDKYNSFNYWYISPDLPLDIDFITANDSVVIEQASNSSTQQIVPQQLIEHFVSMAKTESTPFTDESNLCYHCAFSFPAVALTLGKENWGLLHQAYCTLAADLHWKTRRTVAGSLHELATILGETISTEHLAPLFNGFIKDLDEVRFGVLKHMAHFFSLIRPNQRVQYLPHLKNFLLIDAKLNWRFRAELANQLLLSITLWSSKDVTVHLAPLALSLLLDKVAAVRSSAVLLVSDLINYIQEDTEDISRFLAELAEQFAHSKRWVRRQTFAALCSRIISRRMLSVDIFVRDLMPHLLDLGWDPVPNVRLTVARTVANDIIKHEYFADPMCKNYETLIMTLKRLQTDKDRDVRQAASTT